MTANILVVTSRYYSHIAAELEAGLTEALEAGGASAEFLEVTGAFELPGAAANPVRGTRWMHAPCTPLLLPPFSLPPAPP